MLNGYKEISAKDCLYTRPKSNGMAYEHREMGARKIGRELKDEEVVHHIDEDRSNNNPENLIIFATSADHTAHHKGASLIPLGDGTFKSQPQLAPNLCSCGMSIAPQSTMCFDCILIKRRENIPSKEELEVLLWEIPSTRIAQMYDVSDTTVKKWARYHNLSKPPRGYWQKQASL
jgi:hypothetical protein